MVSDKTRFRDIIEKFKKSMEESEYAYIGVELSHTDTPRPTHRHAIVYIRRGNLDRT